MASGLGALTCIIQTRKPVAMARSTHGDALFWGTEAAKDHVSEHGHKSHLPLVEPSCVTATLADSLTAPSGQALHQLSRTVPCPQILRGNTYLFQNLE